MVLWLAITPLAVLTHELGHAFFARAAGAKPAIALAGFGGVTTYRPPRELSRGRSLGISLAGPAVGLAIGFVLVAFRAGLADGLSSDAWQLSALRIGIFTCIGWSVFNLLPVLPLDGGQAMRELLPGSPATRLRRATAVSAVSAAIAAVVVYVVFRQPFAALFLAFFAVSNGLALRQPATVGARAPSATSAQAIVALLSQGKPAEARELLASVPTSTPVDLAVHGAVLALTGDRQQGHALLDQELARRPGDAGVAHLLVLTYSLEHDWDGVIRTLEGPVGPSVPAPAIARAITEARETGREDVAGRLQLHADPHGA